MTLLFVSQYFDEQKPPPPLFSLPRPILPPLLLLLPFPTPNTSFYTQHLLPFSLPYILDTVTDTLKPLFTKITNICKTSKIRGLIGKEGR